MAKGYNEHMERRSQLNMLGKELTRRAHASCELCAASGVALAPYEVPPVPAEPTVATTLFLCETCRTQIATPRQLDPERWRFVAQAVWSEIPAVQVMAVRMLQRLAKTEPWAASVIEEELYLDDETAAWAAKAD